MLDSSSADVLDAETTMNDETEETDNLEELSMEVCNINVRNAIGNSPKQITILKTVTDCK